MKVLLEPLDVEVSIIGITSEHLLVDLANGLADVFAFADFLMCIDGAY